MRFVPFASDFWYHQPRGAVLGYRLRARVDLVRTTSIRGALLLKAGQNEARTRPLGFLSPPGPAFRSPRAANAQGTVLVNSSRSTLKRPAPLMHVQGAYTVLVDGSFGSATARARRHRA